MAKNATTEEVIDTEALSSEELSEIKKVNNVKLPEVSETKEQKGDERYFYKGEVPLTFKKTYGGEILHGMEEDLDEALATCAKHFNKDDGFRFFYKTKENLFTVLVPLKFSNESGDDSESYLAVYKCHCSSVAIKPGSLIQGVDKHCGLVARSLGYAKNR